MQRVEEIRIRDPFIFVEGGMYYMLGTTGNDCWDRGSDLTLYASEDLVNFERVGCMVEEDTLAGYTQIWAPELHKYNGKYYLILSVFCETKGRGSMILVSDSLQGKFRPLTGEYVTPENWWCLDATLFIWKEKPYLIFSNEWINPVTGDGDGALFVAELTADLAALAGKPRKIVSGKYCGFSVSIESGGIRGYVAEGPYAVEEEGKIALYWSTFTEQGYCVVRSKAEDIFGEYVFEKFIFREDGGHAMVFEGKDGKRKIVLHQPNISPDERMKTFELV